MITIAQRLVLAAGLCACFAAATASAQMVIVEGPPEVGGASGNVRMIVNGEDIDPGALVGGRSSLRIRKDDLPRWGRVLGLDQPQIDAAVALLEAAQSQFSEKAEVANKKMDAARAEMNENEDRESIRAMAAAMEELRKQRDAAEAAFLADFRSVLTKEQEARWPKLEMLRRRDRLLTAGFGMISGERVDLTKVVDGLKLDDAAAGKIVSAMEAYESELDSALQARESATKDKMQKQLELLRKRDMEGVQAMRNAEFDARKRVRDVNRRFTDRLRQELPAATSAQFETAVKRAMFPQIYRERHASKIIDAALNLDDLTADQRKAIEAVRDQYARDSASMNKRFEDATLQQEEESFKAQKVDGNADADGRMMLSVNAVARDSEQMVELRKARRLLDEAVQKNIDSTLTPEQREKMPKLPRVSDEGARPATGRMVVPPPPSR